LTDNFNLQMADVISSLILPVQSPPTWVSFIKAGLVIATSDSLPCFSPQMLQNWLACSGSDSVSSFFSHTTGFLAIICHRIDELLITVKYLHNIKMTVLTKILVALDTDRKQASETMLCPVSDNVILASFESSDTLLKMPNASKALQYDAYSPIKVKYSEVNSDIYFYILVEYDFF
jgi:hypothetical protein